MSTRKTITVTENGGTVPVVEVLTGRGFITGKSGSGKSNTASVIVEELLNQGFPVLIVDTDGEYYGLKEEYEILHAGADEECDLQVGPEHAEKLSELALEQSVPIILDVSGYLDEAEAKEIIRGVAQHLFVREKKLKRPFLLLIEEVHEYIPETAGLDDCGRMLVKIAKRGRKRGLGLCGISQRPADVKKDFITQCDWLVWHRLTWENDTNVVRRVIDATYADQVQDLDDGEGILMTDWNDEIRTVRFRRKKTFDAGATPGLGKFERPSLKSVSSAIVEELEEISTRQREREDKTEMLQRKLDERSRRIQELQDQLDRAEDVSRLAEQLTNALSNAANGDAESVRRTVEEIRTEKEKELQSLRKEKQQAKEKNDELQNRIDALQERLEQLEERQISEEKWQQLRSAYRQLGDALDLSNTIIQPSDSDQNTHKGAGSYERFLRDDAVRSEIEEAKEEASSPRYVRGVIKTIMHAGGPVTYDDVADVLGISTTSHVGQAVNALNKYNVVKKTRRGRKTVVDLNVDNLDSIRGAARRKQVVGEL